MSQNHLIDSTWPWSYQLMWSHSVGHKNSLSILFFCAVDLIGASWLRATQFAENFASSTKLNFYVSFKWNYANCRRPTGRNFNPPRCAFKSSMKLKLSSFLRSLIIPPRRLLTFLLHRTRAAGCWKVKRIVAVNSRATDSHSPAENVDGEMQMKATSNNGIIIC